MRDKPLCHFDTQLANVSNGCNVTLTTGKEDLLNVRYFIFHLKYRWLVSAFSMSFQYFEIRPVSAIYRYLILILTW